VLVPRMKCHYLCHCCPSIYIYTLHIHIHNANTYPNYQLLSLYSDNGLLFHFFLIIYFWPPRMTAMTSPPEDVAA
jgi:hypothetical protein